jgi:CubicO group peptidase (beta-lactamase class C family)
VKPAAILLLIALSSLARAQSIDDRFDSVFRDLKIDAKTPGAAVLIRKDGKTIYERTAGVREQRTYAPITPTTNFRLASCTKQFTAMAVMLLVHDGKLRYDEMLTEVFSDFPAYGKKITLRNLLNHSGGLPDYEDLMDLPANKSRWSETKQISDAEVLALLKSADKGKFASGTQWSYSNSGYVVLGAIVAKVSGMTFPAFLHNRIFAPLKMTHTVAFVNGKNSVRERAYGHSYAHALDDETGRLIGGHVETDQSSTSATLGDGGVYSNLVDLAKWDDALTHHTLLSAREMQVALTPFKLPNGRYPEWSGDSGDTDPHHGKPVAYGFGWFLDPYVDTAGKAHERMWHYGDTVGFKSAIMRFPKGGVTIIVLTNRGYDDTTAIADKFAEAAFRK